MLKGINSRESGNKELELPALVNQLRQIIDETEENFLENHRKDFEFLALFLRVRGYDAQRAFESMKKTFKCVQQNPVIYQNIKSSSLQSVFQCHFTYVLKSSDELGRRIAVGHLGSWDPSKIPLRVALASILFLGHEDLFRHQNAQTKGLQIIVDLEGLSFHHLKELTPMEIKRYIPLLQGGFPVKVKGIHLINYPSIFCMMYTLVIKLFSKKLRRRIHFHDALESLHKHFSVEILPTILGGKLEKSEAMDNQLITDILAKEESLEKRYIN